MAIVVAVLSLLALLLLRRLHLIFPNHLSDWIPRHQVYLLGIVLFIHAFRRIPRVVDAAVTLLWTAALITPISMLVILAGRSPFPFVDPHLYAIDRALHINVPAIALYCYRHPALNLLSWPAYKLFLPLIAASATVPCLLDKREAAHQFVLAGLIGMLAGIVLFIFLPAAGPWTSASTHVYPPQQDMTLYLLALRSRLPVLVELGRAGIISFPSEHVIVGILAAKALGSNRFVKWPAWIACGLLCLSTVTTGWHYGVDVLGGIAVAFVSSAAAGRITRLFAVPAQQASLADSVPAIA